jgi:hypothetical protein
MLPTSSWLSEEIITGGHTMAGMRDYTDEELEIVRKSFGGR